MAETNTIIDQPLAALSAALAKEILSIEDLNDLIAITTDPEKLKVLVAALQKAKAKEAAKAERIEEEVRELHETAQAARARVQQAEEVIRAALKKIDADQTPQGATSKSTP